jgi:hypothetical protein
VIVLDCVGLALILVGAFQASRAHDERGGLTWLNVALLGLLVAGVSNGSWLFAGRSMVTSAVQEVVLHAGPGALRAGTISRRQRPASTPGPLAHRLVAVGGSARFHSAACPFVADRPVLTASRREHERAGRSACEVCEP